jgi:hypothetical protein
MQREDCLSVVRKSRDRTLSTLLAYRQSSTALRVLLVNDAEGKELRKKLIRRSRLMMRSFNLQQWSQDGSVRTFRFRSADISQITTLLTWPVECPTVDARVRTQRKRYIFDPEEGLCVVLALLSTVEGWREMEQVCFRSACVCWEIFSSVVCIFFSQFSPLVSNPLDLSVDMIFITICAPLTL